MCIFALKPDTDSGSLSLCTLIDLLRKGGLDPVKTARVREEIRWEGLEDWIRGCHIPIGGSARIHFYLINIIIGLGDQVNNTQLSDIRTPLYYRSDTYKIHGIQFGEML